MSVNEKMTAIADNIRSKTGGTEALTLDDMASGVNEVYEAGKKEEYNEFWDSFQNNGSRLDYRRAFAGNSWSPSIFKPKYPIKPTNAEQMFYLSTYLTCDITEVSDIDFSSSTNLLQTFQNFYGNRIGVLDTRKATNITNMVVNCSRLVTIDKIIVGENLPSTLSFNNDSRLENVTIEGILVRSVNAAACPLTVASMKSIISALKDYAGTDSEYTYTGTFKASAFNALEFEGATAEYNGVACTWAELIDNKKWNLTLA